MVEYFVLLFVCVCVVVVLSTAPTGARAFYNKGTDVLLLDNVSYIPKIEKSKFLWVIEIYRLGCGYCQQLSPHYEKVAKKLRKLVRVAAVDAEKHVDVARQLEQKYGFQLKGVPTIFLLKPQANGKKKFIPYNGGRTYSHIYNEALSHMPDHSRYVTSTSLAKFRREDSLPSALLITSKKNTPPIWKALSCKYKGKMKLGISNPTQGKLLQDLNITEEEVPAIVLVSSKDESVNTPLIYTGPTTFIAIDFFLMDHIKDKRTQTQTQSDETKHSSNNSDNVTDRGHETNKENSASDDTTTASTASTDKQTWDKQTKDKQTSGREGKKRKKRATTPTTTTTTSKSSQKDKSSATKSSKKKKKTENTKSPKHVHKSEVMDVHIPDNLEKLKISELREVLKELNDPCSGCVEKKHMVERISQYRALQQQAHARDRRASQSPCQKQNAKLKKQIKKLEEKLADSEREKAILQSMVGDYKNEGQFDTCSFSPSPSPSPSSTTTHHQHHDPLIEELDSVDATDLHLTVNEYGIAEGKQSDDFVDNDGDGYNDNDHMEVVHDEM
eukprot:m.98544 g.98544  ORF g.98544 m.98544 type:complete len:556 (+) comp12522_c0_seq1:2487-4154(+)